MAISEGNNRWSRENRYGLGSLPETGPISLSRRRESRLYQQLRTLKKAGEPEEKMSPVREDLGRAQELLRSEMGEMEFMVYAGQRFRQDMIEDAREEQNRGRER